MPILEVEVVEARAGRLPEGVAQRVADAAGRVLGSEPAHTWVRLRRLAREDYAENESPLGPDLAPVFVKVLESEVPSGEALERRVSELTVAVARALERPSECVHVLYEPRASGRIAFGGRLRKNPPE